MFTLSRYGDQGAFHRQGTGSFYNVARCYFQGITGLNGERAVKIIRYVNGIEQEIAVQIAKVYVHPVVGVAGQVVGLVEDQGSGSVDGYRPGIFRDDRIAEVHIPRAGHADAYVVGASYTAIVEETGCSPAHLNHAVTCGDIGTTAIFNGTSPEVGFTGGGGIADFYVLPVTRSFWGGSGSKGAVISIQCTLNFQAGMHQ